MRLGYCRWRNDVLLNQTISYKSIQSLTRHPQLKMGFKMWLSNSVILISLISLTEAGTCHLIFEYNISYSVEDRVYL